MQQPEMIFSVSELNEYVAALLSADPNLRSVRVRGEISGFKRHSSGHLYFSLKDANAVVQCVMFRQYAQRMSFRPEDGQQVTVSGAASIYTRDGKFQVYVQEMENTGKGDLYARFMKMKEDLEREGLFDESHKKPVPYLPGCVGVVTSGTGAALQDILQIIGRRFPTMNLLLCPVRVQGDGAAQEIAGAIYEMNRLQAADVLIVGRGGGSIEDLWAFNEPEVARAIYDSRIPVISAVGHETDFTIADFTADMRAPTPSAAAELAVPELDKIRLLLGRDRERLDGILEKDLSRRRDKLSLLFRSPGFMQAEMRLSEERTRLETAAERMLRGMSEKSVSERHRLERMRDRLEALSVQSVLDRGFTMIRGQDGRPVKSIEELESGDAVEIRFRDGTADAEITTIRRND
ncbi:MAG: exodeoxyribonuclease VII large subunit [Clostridia bacterium]|nr:exodeoxyribonuclease VII large subunit [Clostridia bacterium]MBR0443764.1 exodeoxyribonuclease VII large subunit [Clostridia bacterium]